MLTKNYQHPIHAYRAAQMLVKRAIAELRPRSFFETPVPQLFKSLDYYFTFETQPRQEWNVIYWGLCCFTCDGEIIFARNGQFDVSLWRFRRQGLARTAAAIESVIKHTFRRAKIPLEQECPFSRDADGIYRANICWWKYESLLPR